jgi:hypothetical protein
VGEGADALVVDAMVKKNGCYYIQYNRKPLGVSGSVLLKME